MFLVILNSGDIATVEQIIIVDCVLVIDAKSSKPGSFLRYTV